MIDLRRMRHFVAVAEELHFGRASRRLNMAQPPLSQSIQRLEAELGVELLYRSSRTVELTEAGMVFLAEARRTLSQAELAVKMTRRAAEKVVEVRISFIGPALYRLLPSLLLQFRQEHPDIAVRLHERTSQEQIRGILSGDYDIGFVTAGADHIEGCQTRLVEAAPLVAAIPADWPLARKSSVTLAELAEHPFILPPRKLAAKFSDTLEMFKSLGIMPNVTQEATQTNTTLSLVAAGVGCSLLTASAHPLQPARIVLLPIEDLPSFRRWELHMAWPPQMLGKAAQAFLSMTERQLEAHPEWLDPKAPVTTV